MTGQLTLELDHAQQPKRGGKRKGAGRPPTAKYARHDSPHTKRPNHVKRFPLHVVVRVVDDLPALRSPPAYEAIGRAIGEMHERVAGFRIVHVSIQQDHIHFLVEAGDSTSRWRGMHRLMIRIARYLNRAFGRRGRVFAVRYHATPITSPTQMRNVLAYVFGNWRHHDEHLARPDWILDPYSTAIAFPHWNRRFSCPARYVPLPVVPAETWMMCTGWTLADPRPLDPYFRP